MRKILIMVLIIILLITGYLLLFKGLNVFSFSIASIWQIKDKSDNLDGKLQQVSTLTSTTYPKAIADLNDSTKQLLMEKDNYADLVTYSSNEDVNAASQLEKYEVEYLWTKIGNHATKNEVTLKLDIKTSTTGASSQYDLNFIATGKYASISEFIASMEDDSSLGFKIEEFKLNPSTESTEILQATFTVRDVAINIQNIATTSTTGNTTNSITNTTQTNTNTVNQNTAP